MPKSVSARKKQKKSSFAATRHQEISSFVPAHCFEASRSESTLPIFVVAVEDYATWVASAPAEIQVWLKSNRFKAKPGACALLPQADGCSGALITVEEFVNPWEYAGLVRVLPEGSFEAEPELEPEVAEALCLGWLLSSYQFNRYKSKAKAIRRTLVWPEGADRALVLALGEGACLGRDLVNTPASDMGPEELAAAAARLAKQHGAQCATVVGDDLLAENFPMIHAVGRASSREPRLIDLRWGKSHHPKLTLVGKGVCFDTGGLDVKPPQYMKLMKKDMGGAAFVLALAHVVMSQRLPVRLRVLIPAVENSVSGNAMRPLDVLETRKGITVEVGDTDAEGRLILGDALFEARSQNPDLIIDAATLTGAARVALGTEVPVIFSNFDATWTALFEAANASFDPLWRLPLFDGYRRKLESKVADISNISSDSYGGAIIAALFLREFVSRQQDWIHMDTMGFNLEASPGRPYGGETLGLLAMFRMLRARYENARAADAPPPMGKQTGEAREEPAASIDKPHRKKSTKKKKSPSGRPDSKKK